jgi:hypothetical protein
MRMRMRMRMHPRLHMLLLQLIHDIVVHSLAEVCARACAACVVCMHHMARIAALLSVQRRCWLTRALLCCCALCRARV